MSDTSPLQDDAQPESVPTPHVDFFPGVAPATGQWTAWISKLLNYEDAKSIPLPLNEVRGLCQAVKDVLSKEPNLLAMPVEEGAEWVVVGDIHGQFNDMVTHVLCHQLRAAAEGGPNKKFLFLGDFVDRGPQSVEVITLLLCLKVEYPEYIYMVRGNHEEAQTSRMYGFLAECRIKFMNISAWHVYNEVFRELPLAANLSFPNEKSTIFCCHGGLSPSFEMIDALAFVARQEYGESFHDTNVEIVDGLLWSDPAEVRGCVANERGCGFSFGQDATDTFCKDNNVKFICRAHQVVMNGYQWTHDEKVLTVFSAPNYCGVSRNKGAVMLLSGSKGINPEFYTYDVAPPPVKSGAPVPPPVAVEDPMPASPPMMEGSAEGSKMSPPPPPEEPASDSSPHIQEYFK